MSMQFLTLLQLLGVALLYIGVFILIPAAVFHRKFKERPAYVRFMAYFSIGNFYIMNLVLFLQLFHISNRTTLILGVVLPALIMIGVLNWQDWVKATLVNAGETTHNVLVNTMGFRLFMTKIFQIVWQAVGNLGKAMAESISVRWVDWVGTILIIALTVWQYGTNLFLHFGYTASDMLVHNYWINSMNSNDIFVGGVYPFGFHCVIYYLHAVFGVENFVILRVFSLIETVMIHLMLLCFLRLILRMETLAYGTVALYLLLNVWSRGTYIRYLSALPQEYGMIFILPAVCFLLLFLRDRWENREEKGFRNESTQALVLFAMNVSMSFAAHFYDTIALGFCCLAIAVGFATRVFRKEFFPRIVVAGVLALLAAVFPLWVAYIGGTPMEGSLRWGVSVMKGQQEQIVPDAAKEILVEYGMDEDGGNTGSGAVTDTGNAQSDSSVSNQTDAGGSGEAGSATVQAKPAQKGGRMVSFFRRFIAYLGGYIFEEGNAASAVFVLIVIALGFVLGIFKLLLKDTEYGSVLITISVNILFFCVLLMSKELGIPVLMDKNRCSVYLTYFFIPLLGMVMDFVVSLLFGFAEGELTKRVLPGVVFLGLFVFLWIAGAVREPAQADTFQKNGAIISVTNILRDNKKHSFTIISANDELRLIEDYGFHFEANRLLVENMGNNASGFLIIPTSKIYVFVEKTPGDYDEPYEGSGQPISRESASRPLPVAYGIGMYKGSMRHIVMSKLYFWAQEFAHLFENEIYVYYEDDEFVCYAISQNVDRPYDMSFAYGYNN